MKIEEIMSEEVTCINLDDRLSVVRELFIKHKFHHLMVTDSKNQLVAVFLKEII